MTKYGKSPWLDRFPTSRVSAYAKPRGSLQTDVVIVGGGLTGCTAAYAFAAAGIKVMLLEGDRIGRGSSCRSVGWVAEDPGASFVAVEKAIGLRGARHVFRAWRRSALDFSALLRRLEIKCHLEPMGAATVATTADQAIRLKREQRSRQDAGLDAPMLRSRVVKSEVALDAPAAIRSRDGAVLDPYRACLGLAAAAQARGAVLFERSPVKRIKFSRKTVEVFTDGGSIRADRVVVCTGTPGTLFRSLVRHVWTRLSFQVLTEPLPAKVRHGLGQAASVVRDLADPSHVVRWVGDNQLLVCGADTDALSAHQRDKVVVQRTGQLMYELSTLYPDISGTVPQYGWDASYGQTVDGLPFVGPHRNFPRHLFAFGDASRSVTGAYLASRILLRHHLEEIEPSDAPFEFTRYGR